MGRVIWSSALLGFALFALVFATARAQPDPRAPAAGAEGCPCGQAGAACCTEGAACCGEKAGCCGAGGKRVVSWGRSDGSPGAAARRFTCTIECQAPKAGSCIAGNIKRCYDGDCGGECDPGTLECANSQGDCSADGHEGVRCRCSFNSCQCAQ